MQKFRSRTRAIEVAGTQRACLRGMPDADAHFNGKSGFIFDLHVMPIVLHLLSFINYFTPYPLIFIPYFLPVSAFLP
jgi:hypothetical protein